MTPNGVNFSFFFVQATGILSYGSSATKVVQIGKARHAISTHVVNA